MRGTPLDNAAVESFFGWFKDELYTDYRPINPEQLRKAVVLQAFFYNHERTQPDLKTKHPFPTGMRALSIRFLFNVFKDLTSSVVAVIELPRSQSKKGDSRGHSFVTVW
jgi:hypothetical protein